MPDIIVEGQQRKQFELPTAAIHTAVLAEVNDLGIVAETFEGVTKQVHKIQFIWQIAEADTEGKRKLLFERFTKSLDEKANLRKRIKDMFDKEPPMSLNVSKLVGSNAQLLVVHVTGKKDPLRTYANIKAVLKADATKPKLEALPIERKKKDTQVAPVSNAGTAVTEDNPITNEDIPW